MTTVAVRSAYYRATAKEGAYGYDSRTLNSEPDELLKILSFCGLVKKERMDKKQHSFPPLLRHACRVLLLASNLTHCSAACERASSVALTTTFSIMSISFFKNLLYHSAESFGVLGSSGS